MTVPPKVAEVIRAVAPTLASALAGPLAPVAAVVVSAALDAWLPAGPGGKPREPIETSPADVVDAVQRNKDDPRFVLDLQKAQLDLQAYERRLPQTFAELERKDRQDARAFTRDAGLARTTFFAGMALVALAMLMLFGVVAGCIAALTGRLRVAPEDAQIAIAAFGLIGTVVGVFQGLSVQVVGFYFGSSAGSKEKTEQLGQALERVGGALAEKAGRPDPPVVAQPAPAPAPVVVHAAAPAAADGQWRQGPFGGQRWRLTPAGVVLEGQAEPLRTVGQPATVRRIWRDFGHLVAASCAANGVPLEIAVATIATESRGVPSAVLVEPDDRRSVGLMQTLVGTASEVMGREVSAAELADPALSIEAGVRYLARQRPKTDFQPPLVAAAYNAGGLYASDDNPWRLRSTGDHVARFCRFYGDCCAVAAEDGWGKA